MCLSVYKYILYCSLYVQSSKESNRLREQGWMCQLKRFSSVAHFLYDSSVAPQVMDAKSQQLPHLCCTYARCHDIEKDTHWSEVDDEESEWMRRNGKGDCAIGHTTLPFINVMLRCPIGCYIIRAWLCLQFKFCTGFWQITKSANSR